MVFPRIRQLRLERGLEPAQMAETLQMSLRVYAAYESGARPLDVDTLTALARFYDVSTDYIASITDQRDPYPKR